MLFTADFCGDQGNGDARTRRIARKTKAADPSR